MPSRTTRSKASNGHARKAAKARRRRSAITRRASYLWHRLMTAFAASAIAPFFPPCSLCVLRREELCKLKVRDFRHAPAKACRTSLVAGKGGKTRCVPLRPGTHELIHDYLYLAGHGEDDALTQLSFASRSVRTRCGRRQPPTRSSTRRTSQRCRNGWDMPTLPRHESTIIAVRRLRIARCSKLPIDAETRLNV